MVIATEEFTQRGMFMKAPWLQGIITGEFEAIDTISDKIDTIYAPQEWCIN